MKAQMTITMDNDAFAEDPQTELSRIFSDMADRINYGRFSDPYIIRDINGNKVGEFFITNK